jgi:hypothetical protein
MISRTKTGRSFGGLARYLVQGHQGQEQSKQSELLGAEGVRTDTIEHMIADFNRGRRVNPGLGQAVWHTSLSFNPDDAGKLDSEKMRAIAEDWMQEMGLMGTQYAIIRHRDKPGHEHLHIVANRVADDGHTISDSNNFYKSKQALTKLIEKHQLTPPQGLRPAQQHPQHLHGAELAKHEIRQVLAATLATATNGRELAEGLSAAGIRAQVFRTQQGKPTGISFAKDGLTFKGSEIGRPYSLAGIERQTAANRQAQQPVVADLARAQLRQVLTDVLATATDGPSLVAGLAAKKVVWRVSQDEARQNRLSFTQDGRTFQEAELGPAYSAQGIAAQLTANRQAQPGPVATPEQRPVATQPPAPKLEPEPEPEPPQEKRRGPKLS